MGWWWSGGWVESNKTWWVDGTEWKWKSNKSWPRVVSKVHIICMKMLRYSRVVVARWLYWTVLVNWNEQKKSWYTERKRIKKIPHLFVKPSSISSFFQTIQSDCWLTVCYLSFYECMCFFNVVFFQLSEKSKYEQTLTCFFYKRVRKLLFVSFCQKKRNGQAREKWRSFRWSGRGLLRVLVFLPSVL